MNNLKTENVSDQLETKFKELFSDLPWLYNKIKSKIYVKENARPVGLKGRNVAHALKPSIENYY